MASAIMVNRAFQHNLKGITLEIPHNNLVVITGVSGSGKSSLVFDVIHAEGQRRYVESLSTYARQFLEQVARPAVESLEGLAPTIAIEQGGVPRNPRSTVGTVTEIYDYLRLLFARIGVPHCPSCGKEIRKKAVQEIVDSILTFEGEDIMILSPVGEKGGYKGVLEGLLARGFSVVRVDGEVIHTDRSSISEEDAYHRVEVVVDAIHVTTQAGERLADAVETALGMGSGVVVVSGREERMYTPSYSCLECGITFEELEPRMFSFNTPHGACTVCHGMGEERRVDPHLVLDKRRSLLGGAIRPRVRPWSTRSQDTRAWSSLEQVAASLHIPLDVPLGQVPQEQLDLLLYGTPDKVRLTFQREGFSEEYRAAFEGIICNLERRYNQTESEDIRSEIEKYMSSADCSACRGQRLKPESLAVTIQGKSIADLTRMSVEEARTFFATLHLSEREKLISEQVVKEIKRRLEFMVAVGLEYVTLHRKTATLSRGEAQRVRLATQIGSSLTGVVYLLDEPSVGLHPRDTTRLLAALQQLRDRGNTVMVTEHDEATIRAADYIIDLGPGAGAQGGYVVAQGTVKQICEAPGSLTGRYLSRRDVIPLPHERLPPPRYLILRGASHHNLKHIDVRIPLGVLVCITGVSGSGKSSLVNDTLYRALAQHFCKAAEKPGEYTALEGAEGVGGVVLLDQFPLGGTPRSNPATYTSLFSLIRELFSQLPESRKRGYYPGRFSFNVKGGRCEACQGTGFTRVEMYFLPDVYVPCEVCGGKRFNESTLQVQYKGKNIADILDMSVEEALTFFANIPRVRRKLETLRDVGMGYVKLGQPATTLSGGEAQRVKLSRELSRKGTGTGTRTMLYILDEPTTGLHPHDIQNLLQVVRTLVGRGDTVLIVEHNLEVIKTADYIIDLGPEGGEGGGRIVGEGPPEVIAHLKTHTGTFLRRALEGLPSSPSPQHEAAVEPNA